MKKLTKKEAEGISDNYCLGKVESLKIFPKGLVNYNYDLKTDRGNFVVRILGHKMDRLKKEKIKLEFDVLNFLAKSDFEYKTPLPIKNKKGNFVTELKDKDFWVYEKIKGIAIRGKIKDKKIFNLVKALATYHKTVKKFKFDRKFDNEEWVLEKFVELRKVVPKNNIDRLMLENLDFFEDALMKMLKKKFVKNLIPTHSDFHKNNALFKGSEVVAMLDFDNLQIGPRVKDVAYFIKQNCFRNSKFDKDLFKKILKEYEKTSKLSKEEKDMIIPLIIKDNCQTFWWFYAEMKKGLDKRELLLRWTIDTTKNLVEELK